MEPLLIILIPGIVGGALVAPFLAHRRAHPTMPAPVRRPLPAPTPGHINMAHIHVDGAGGLGMVAMALAVAISVPWIRMSVSLGLMLGLAVAAALIVWRRRIGPLASSSRHGGAHSDSWAWDEDRTGESTTR